MSDNDFEEGNSTSTAIPREWNYYYAISEVVVAILAIVGNGLVMVAFRRERKLRRRTNYYIVSLACADFLVGLLGIPFALMSSVGKPDNLHACLFTVSLLIVLCTISIFCLVAVSVDRYWAILHPMGYSRNVRTQTAVAIIAICWFSGAAIGFLPLMGWHKSSSSDPGGCIFLDVMDFNYLVFLYFVTIITPSIILAGFYGHIYQVVIKQLRRVVTLNPDYGPSRTVTVQDGDMIRTTLGAVQRNEVKAAQNLAVIVFFFMLCWVPLYSINCAIAINNDLRHKLNEDFMFFCIILSHLNSAGNPLLYAYHLRDFRMAMKNILCGLFQKKRDELEQRKPMTSNNHYSNLRMQHRKPSFSFSFNPDSKLQRKEATNISTIVKNSAAVAVATTGEINRHIWNIPEASHSSESPKNSERIAIIRPPTPFRSHISQSNQAFFDSSSLESDDVFVEDTLPYHDYSFEDFELEPNISILKDKLISKVNESECSSSTPQLSRTVFSVEKARIRRSSLKYNCNFIDLSPCRVSSDRLKNRRVLSRSLSDEAGMSNNHVCLNGGKSVFRSSLGS